MSLSLSNLQCRLFLSATVMMLPFGLVVAMPQIHYNKRLFPSTRLMTTLHLEATQNSLMLAVVGLMLPFVKLSDTLLLVLETSLNVGAWMNVLPWLYGGYTGAVMPYIEGSLSDQRNQTVPKNNEVLVGRIQSCLMTCGLGDTIAWSLVAFGLVNKLMEKKSVE